MPMKISLHGGVVVWKKGNYRALEQVKIVGQYKHEGTWDQADIGVYYHVQRVYGGLLYRGIPFKEYANYAGHESIAAIIGMKFDSGVTFGYSYDFTISKLSNRSGGSHEISLIFTQRKSYRKKIIIPPCMKF